MFDVVIHVEGADIDLLNDIAAFGKAIVNAIPKAARAVIDESVPAGRLYRRGIMTARRSASFVRLGLKPVGRSRMAVGTKIHRASAPGQPPAKDSGALYERITVREGTLKGTVTFGVGYAWYLEEGTSRMAARPFLDETIRRAITEAVEG